MQAYQQKTEKFFVSEEKKFYRIGYWWKGNKQNKLNKIKVQICYSYKIVAIIWEFEIVDAADWLSRKAHVTNWISFALHIFLSHSSSLILSLFFYHSLFKYLSNLFFSLSHTFSQFSFSLFISTYLYVIWLCFYLSLQFYFIFSLSLSLPLCCNLSVFSVLSLCFLI